ncbi:MAG TPA: hypothetical protein VK783_11095 [Bacteroidia bacterium]|nr:hypothetical protein [Bacteroidia bacterium]
MKYEIALPIAEEVLKLLSPHCFRCEIAGSLRRKKSEVGDIDIVLFPRPYGINLLESGIATVVNKWMKVKGELPCKHTQRLLPSGVKLDLFFANKTNWGYIYTIRTGSVEFNKRKLASGWVRKGYEGIEGYLYKEGKRIDVPEEIDLFNLIGLQYVEPEDRD